MKKILIISILIIVFSIFYIITFHLPSTNLVPVYTYYGILSLIFLSIILLITLILIYKKRILDFKDCIITLLLFILTNLFFFCMVPVTLERSISVFMLNEMTIKKYSKEQMEKLFVDKYVYEYDAFNKRFEEQKYIGTVKKNSDKYQLSSKGKNIVKTFKLIKKIYNAKGKVLD